MTDDPDRVPASGLSLAAGEWTLPVVLGMDRRRLVNPVLLIRTNGRGEPVTMRLENVPAEWERLVR